MDFAGSDYSPVLDRERLLSQHQKVKAFMLRDHEWHTLRDIAAAIGEPEASISAQLRHLRRAAFGGFKVEKRRAERGGSVGLFEYRVLGGVNNEQ
jgi:hypothetical protein